MWTWILFIASLVSLWTGHAQAGWLGVGLILFGVAVGFVWGGWSALEFLETIFQKQRRISLKATIREMLNEKKAERLGQEKSAAEET